MGEKKNTRDGTQALRHPFSCSFKKYILSGTCLVVQQLRVRLAMQGTRV